MPARGRLIALEGIDGCGKSTQASALADVLGAQLTFEPGATPVGARLRELLLTPDATPPTARAEALLMAADRAEHVVRVVEPALAAGEWVVSDRYAGSTIAYQGYGQGLDPSELVGLVRWATGGLAADLVPTGWSASGRTSPRGYAKDSWPRRQRTRSAGSSSTGRWRSPRSRRIS
jgi:dTMP kinase